MPEALPAEKLKLPEFFFFPRSGSYFLQERERYLELSERDVKRHLMLSGLRKVDREDGLTTLDYQIIRCQQRRSVEYAGPVAGHSVGLIKLSGGDQILVTQSTRPVEPKPGPIPHWERFLTELLPGEQWMRFVAWLQFALRTFAAGDYRPGQALILAGPARCGKSFLQLLITELLGGRAALPYRYMTDKTQFNEDLASGEHWMIEDQGAATDLTSRRAFGAKLKEAVANKFYSIHGKGKLAVILPLFRRVTISVNKEPENLMIIPPLDDSLMDKMTLLMCSVAHSLTGDYGRDWRAFTKELPALVDWVMKFQIPKTWAHKSYGVVSWHHPELLEALNEMAPEVRLLSLIDSALFDRLGKVEGVEKGVWTGKADALELLLMRDQDTGFASQRLLRFPSACGTYLARLAAKTPRVEARKNEGKTRWIIRAP